MEIKKAPSADLEKDKGLSLLLGLIVSLSLVFVVLEWRSARDSGLNANAGQAVVVEDVMVIQDEQKPEDTPPPPAAPMTQPEIQLPEEFKVVDNNKEVAKLNIISVDEGKTLPPPTVVAGPAVVEDAEAEQIFEIVEENPEFPGGVSALYEWIGKNLQYPEVAQENGIQGRVQVSFVVERDGRPSDVKILRGVDASLDKEAIRVIKAMPKWKPGMQRGKAVRTRYNIPVVFRLQ